MVPNKPSAPSDIRNRLLGSGHRLSGQREGCIERRYRIALHDIRPDSQPVRVQVLVPNPGLGDQ